MNSLIATTSDRHFWASGMRGLGAPGLYRCACPIDAYQQGAIVTSNCHRMKVLVAVLGMQAILTSPKTAARIEARGIIVCRVFARNEHARLLNVNSEHVGNERQ